MKCLKEPPNFVVVVVVVLIVFSSACMFLYHQVAFGFLVINLNLNSTLLVTR